MVAKNKQRINMQMRKAKRKVFFYKTQLLMLGIRTKLVSVKNHFRNCSSDKFLTVKPFY